MVKNIKTYNKTLHISIFIIIILIFSISLINFISLVQGSTQAEITKRFTCYADSYVDSSNPSSNYGSTDLEVSNSSYRERNSYLSFRIKDLPSDASVTVVKLELSVKWLPYDEHTVPLDIWKTTSFNEMDITWDTRPGKEGLLGEADIAENKRWNIILTNHNITGNSYFHVCLSTDLDNSATITFDSQDDIWNPPKLAVIFQSYQTSESYSTDVSGFILFVFLLGVIGTGLYVIYKRNKQSSSPPRRWIVDPKKKDIKPHFIPSKRYCSECGTPLNTNDTFCVNCGSRTK